MTIRKAAFLDRDGVINVDVGYLHHVADVSYPPHAIDGLRALAALGYELIAVTNQSGIGRGYFTQTDLDEVTQFLTSDLARYGVKLLATYYCPHHPDEGCECRKPLPGMLLRAAADYDIDLASSLMVGDKESDIQAGRAAGVAHRVLLSIGPAVPLQEGEVQLPDLHTTAAWLSDQVGS